MPEVMECLQIVVYSVSVHKVSSCSSDNNIDGREKIVSSSDQQSI
jgi:hypothetical protein